MTPNNELKPSVPQRHPRRPPTLARLDYKLWLLYQTLETPAGDRQRAEIENDIVTLQLDIVKAEAEIATLEGAPQ